jgi:hypothetical protein
MPVGFDRSALRAMRSRGDPLAAFHADTPAPDAAPQVGEFFLLYRKFT